MEKVNDILDQCSEINWSVDKSGQRHFIPERVKEYLDKIVDQNDRLFVKRIIENTKYVTWDELTKCLNQSFDKFHQKIKDQGFYLYWPHKFGSEMIFTIFLWKKIRSLNFLGFKDIKDKINDNDNIVVIDDSIYCGNNVSSIVDEMTYNNKSVKINFHLIIPFCSYNGIKQISTICQNANVEFYDIIKTTSIYEMFEEYQTKDALDYFGRFGLEFTGQIPLYFDHKIANEFSTFPTIYINGIIPDKVSGIPSNYGSLIKYKPDTDLKMTIWKKYFIDIYPNPTC